MKNKNDAENIMFWIVGQYKEDKSTFELQGLFSTEEKAINACRDRTYFVHPMILDKEIPHETVKWNGYYPIEE